MKKRFPFPVILFYGVYAWVMYVIISWTNSSIVWFLNNILFKNVDSAWIISTGLTFIFQWYVLVFNLGVEILKFFVG